MLGSNPPQIILGQQTKSTYLSVQRDHTPPLCGNDEGWGPLSSVRWDFTPCFLDVWVDVVSIWGILGGLAAVLYLYKRRSPQPVKQDLHFWAKLAVIGALFADIVLQAILQMEAFAGIWYRDFRFW